VNWATGCGMTMLAKAMTTPRKKAARKERKVRNRPKDTSMVTLLIMVMTDTQSRFPKEMTTCRTDIYPTDTEKGRAKAMGKARAKAMDKARAKVMDKARVKAMDKARVKEKEKEKEKAKERGKERDTFLNLQKLLRRLLV
jgi:hypothetical protein